MTCGIDDFPNAKQAAKSALQRAGMAQGACSRCSGRMGLRSVLRIREERFCPPCVGAHLRSRASRGLGGIGAARGAALATGRKRVLLSHSGRAGGATLLRLTADFFHTDPLLKPDPKEETEQPRPAAPIDAEQAPFAMGAGEDDDDLFGPVRKERKVQRRGPPREVDYVDVVHVDSSALLPGDWKEVHARRQRRRQVLQQAVDAQNALVAEKAERPYRLLVLGVEDVYAPDTDLVAVLKGDMVQPGLEAWDGELDSPAPAFPNTKAGADARLCAIRKLFGQVLGATRTDKSALSRAEGLHEVLVDVLLRRIGGLGGYAALLYGTSATRHAVTFLSGLAEGRGAGLSVSHAQKVWFAPPAGDSVLLLRPLSETAAKETAYVARQLDLHMLLPMEPDIPFLAPGLGLASATGSIGRLTGAFVQSLERGVSSTSSTVGGITGKLALPEQQEQQEQTEIVAPHQPRLHGALQHKFLSESLDAPAWGCASGFACALCLLPRGREHAQSWRERNALTALGAHAGSATPGGAGTLSSRLCFGCAIVLPAGLLSLPSHVGKVLAPEAPADAVAQSPSSCGGGCGCEPGSGSGSGGQKCGSSRAGADNMAEGAPATRPPMRKVGREEIKAQLSGFLLPDE